MDTQSKIQTLGVNLANEVVEIITQNFDGDIERLSFIGHSLGGLIIRAALPLLKQYKSKMYTYLSLGTPHLGCIANTSFLVKTGMK